MSDRGLGARRRRGAEQPPQERVFLFLQGPISPFFARLATALEARGHRVLRVNLCFGDWLLWRRSGARNYRGRAGDWPAFIAALMDREGVTDLLLLGEQRGYHRVAIEAAKARSIPVVVTDFGYLRPDWLAFELDGMSGASRFPRDPDAIRALARQVDLPDPARRYGDSFVVMAALDVLYNASTSLMRPLYPHYRTHHLHHPVIADLGIGLQGLLRQLWRNRRSNRIVAEAIKDNTRYYLMPLQMKTDYQIRAYSAYDGLEAPIRDVIQSFARSAPRDAKLFIKVHPYDPGLDNWRRIASEAASAAGVSGRVIYLYGGSLDRLIPRVHGVVTVNSTVGLHALRADSPVVCLGEAIYDVPGLTFQGPLDRFWTDAVPPDPELRDDLVRAIAGTIQIRGDFYREPGLGDAVEEAAERLDYGLVNVPRPSAASPLLDLAEPSRIAR